MNTLRLLLMAAASVFLAACTGTPRTADLPVLRPLALTPQAWYFEGASGMAQRDNAGFTSNAGFVITDDGIVVFDALATPALARAMLARIRELSDQPVRLLIVSHYHADHVYGLQVFREAGAKIWARREGAAYLGSEQSQERLAQRRVELAPWVDAQTRLVAADRWLDFPADAPISFSVGSTRFELLSGGESHSAGDLMLSVPGQQLLFAGDLFFTGRLPFVVDGNTAQWLRALARIERSAPRVVVPGHGAASRDVGTDLQLTRRYLEFLRREMGQAVEALEDFDSAYARIDWSAFSALPTFEQANRRNAYTVYLEMQAELLHREAQRPPAAR